MLTDHYMISYTIAKLHYVGEELANPATNTESVTIDKMVYGIAVPHFLPPR
jgi:hypothetical protein